MKWILYCLQCNGVIVHSEIERESLGFAAYTNFTKPQFPDIGLSIVCPSCKSTSVYQRHQLVYQNS
jgi:hypothetical protein